MKSNKKLTSEYIESLQEKNDEIVYDIISLESFDKMIREKEDELKYLKNMRKKTADNCSDFRITDICLTLYSDNIYIDKSRLVIKYILASEMHLAGFYDFSGKTFNIVIPNYLDFIEKGYYKGDFVFQNEKCTVIIVNEYTTEIIKEIMYMRLKSNLISMVNSKKKFIKKIKRCSDIVKNISLKIDSYHEIDNEIMKEMYDDEYFPTNMKDEFMNSLPRKIDVHKLLEEDNETSEDPQ